MAQSPQYRMQDEAVPHLRIFMQWPVSRRMHSDPVFLGMLQDTITLVANTIAQFEPVVILMAKAKMARARRELDALVELWDAPSSDLWCRDSGPVFVKDSAGNQAIANLNFNGWGNRQLHRHDGASAATIAQHLGLPPIDSGVVGGGIQCATRQQPVAA